MKIEITHEQVLALISQHLAASLTPDLVAAERREIIRETVGALTFEQVYDELRLVGKDKLRTVREFCRKHGIPVVHEGRNRKVRIARLIEWQEAHEVKLALRALKPAA